MFVCLFICSSIHPYVPTKALSGLKSTLSDPKFTLLGFEFVRAGLGLEWTYFRPKKADFRPERADFRPERVDSSLRGQILGLKGPGRDAQTDRKMDEQTNEQKSPPNFYGTSSPSGPLSKKHLRHSFLDASSHLYKRLCPCVCLSV